MSFDLDEPVPAPSNFTPFFQLNTTWPTNADYEENNVLIMACILSFIGALTVILTYNRVPTLHVNPYNLICTMAKWDMCAAVCMFLARLVILIAYFLVGEGSIYFLNTTVITPVEAPTAANNFAILSLILAVAYFIVLGLGAYFRMGSLAFNGLIAVNLILNTTKPFADTSFLNTIGRWPIRLFPVAVFIAWIYLRGNGYSKEEEIPMGWETIVPVFVIFTLCIISLIFTLVKTQTINRRKKALKLTTQIRWQMIFFIIVFCLSWVFPTTAVILSSMSLPSSLDLMKAVFIKGATLGPFFTGILNALVWFATPSLRKEVKKLYCRDKGDEKTGLIDGDKEGGNDLVKINAVFRKNLLVCILVGLRNVLVGDHVIKLENMDEDKKSPKNSSEKDVLIDIEESSKKEEKRTRSVKEIPQELPSKSGTKFVVLDDTDLLTPTSANFFEEDLQDVDDDVFVNNFSIEVLSVKAFNNIQQQRGMTAKYIYDILNPSQFLKDAMKKQKFSDGRSGSFFVFSPDNKIILKTIPKEEYDVMQRILPNYYRHLKQHPNSLVMRILAAAAVQVMDSTTYVILMENIFANYPYKIHQTFDLKGSWIDRGGDPKVQAKVKKDNDLNFKFQIGNNLSTKLLNQLQLDSNLLQNNNIMDYSLLIGIHNFDLEKTSENEAKFAEKKDEKSVEKDESSVLLDEDERANTEAQSNASDVKSYHSEFSEIPSEKEAEKRKNVDIDIDGDESESQTDGTEKPKQEDNTKKETALNLLTSENKTQVFIVGIIDILQDYNLNKKLEHYSKALLRCKDSHGISAVEPHEYCNRFNGKMAEHFN